MHSVESPLAMKLSRQDFATYSYPSPFTPIAENLPPVSNAAEKVTLIGKHVCVYY